MLYRDYLKSKYQKAAVKLANAEGVPCVLEYSKGKNIRNYEVCGNSVQSGTPSPENPVEIQSVGDLVTDTASEYYGKYDVPITVRGKNLLKYPYASESSTRDGLTYTINSDTSITISGTATANSYIVLMRNCDFGETSIAEGSTNGIYSTSKKLRYNAVSKAVSINFKLGDTVDEIFYPQIEYGTVSTAYEPYKGSETTHIYLDEPLRKIGDYADYIDFKNQNVVRNINSMLIKATATLNNNETDETAGFYFRVDDRMIINDSTNIQVLSPSLPGAPRASLSKDTSLITAYPNSSVIAFKLSKTLIGGDTSVLVNKYLENNPITIYYILATPTEENISLPALKTFKGTSVMSVDTSIQPSNIKANYIRT